MISINNAKSFKKGILKKNVSSYLSENFDWKVSRSVASGQPLSDKDKQFRASVIAEYNNRIEVLDTATSMEEINEVKLTF